MNIPPSRSKMIVIDECRRAGFSRAVIRSEARQGPIVEARRQIAVRLRGELGLSLWHIAMILNRDHSSVMNLLDGGARRRRKYEAIKALAAEVAA